MDGGRKYSECAKATHACGLNATLAAFLSIGAGWLGLLCIVALQENTFIITLPRLLLISIQRQIFILSFLGRRYPRVERHDYCAEACEFVDCVVREGETQRLYARVARSDRWSIN